MPQESLTKSARARIKDKAKIEAMEAQLAASQRQVEALKKDRERRLERLERRASHQGDDAGGPSNAPPPQAHAQEPKDGLQVMIDGLAALTTLGSEPMYTPQQEVIIQGSPTGLTEVHRVRKPASARPVQVQQSFPGRPHLQTALPKRITKYKSS